MYITYALRFKERSTISVQVLTQRKSQAFGTLLLLLMSLLLLIMLLNLLLQMIQMQTSAVSLYITLSDIFCHSRTRYSTGKGC